MCGWIFFSVSQSTKSLHMDTHEEQDTHLGDPQGSQAGGSQVGIPIDQVMADEAIDPGLGDHGLVDVIDFCRLEVCTTFLEKHLANTNQDLTDLTTLVKNMVLNPNLVAPGVGEAAQASPTVPVSVNPILPSSSATSDASNAAKHLKPSSFKGEEKDWNKDTVHTFSRNGVICMSFVAHMKSNELLRLVFLSKERLISGG